MGTHNKVRFAGAVACVCLLASCGGSGKSENNSAQTLLTTETEGTAPNSIDCVESSQKKPIPSKTTVRCGDWELNVAEAVLVPNNAVKDASFVNETSDDKSWIVIPIEATYLGSGVGRRFDIANVTNYLVGSNGVGYQDKSGGTVDFEAFAEDFGPTPYNSPDPFSGGTIKVSQWFWVDNSDSEFKFLISSGDPFKKFEVWFDVSTGA